MNDIDTISKDVFGNSTPHLSDIGKSAAIALVNSHPILDGAKYYNPAIVQIPGFHIDEPKKLDAVSDVIFRPYLNYLLLYIICRKVDHIDK